MSLSDLSASEIARIDAICMDYEAQFRDGGRPDIAELVAEHGGPAADVLRRELELVRSELENDDRVFPSPGAVDSVRGPDSDSVDLSRPGTRIGPYVILGLLGRGGMGVVFEAVDTRLDRQVAIKVLAVEIAKRRDLTERFEREARAVAAISHPNIVELFDVGVSEGLPYAVMEYLDGELLEARLQRGQVTANEVRRIGAQIADALATAHQAEVVHRDLKPHNIMLVTRSGGEFSEVPASMDSNSEIGSTIVKLFDFGLSRAPHIEFDESGDQTSGGLILGTPGYMAPEQVRGEVVTPAADIFSLGCVLFEAFYGKRAFDGPSKAARFSSTLEDEPIPDAIRRREDIELADLIQQCLHKNAAQRPPSAALIAQHLRRTVRPADSQANSPDFESSWHRLTRRRLLVVAGGGIAGSLVGALAPGRTGDELASIRSMAVLSFTDESVAPDAPTTTPPPIGDSELHRGEQLAALLVHELTRLSEVTVPRFRPVVAETPSEFREIGRVLEVDALLTGSLRTMRQGVKEFLELDMQIISAKTGNQLWGKRIQAESRNNLLEQSALATEIASVIGHRLTSTAAELAPPSVESFKCLVDGKTRSDPDSLRGLEMALACFQKAHDVDRRFADPIAGIALTSITLAAQTNTEKSVELIRQARQSVEEALLLDPNSIDARLTLAMLDWQTLGRYQQADRAFEELVMVAPNHWQVRHQYGLLQLTTGRMLEAGRSLREASQLNPMSVLVKVDRARAQWFSGNVQRAIQDAILIRDKYDNSRLARGLIVDIHEHHERFDLAAAAHDSFPVTAVTSRDGYFRERHTMLGELPYGPFGDAPNEAIWRARSTGDFDDLALAELTDPMPPMFPLLLSAHPSLGAARLLPRAKEILPS